MTLTFSDRILARYFIETAVPLELAAETMAGEQSSGTFVRVPGETAELRERFAARVESIVALDHTDTPSLAGARPGARYQRAEVLISWPVENMGASLPMLMATVAGNLYELKAFSGLKLLDIALPAPFFEKYAGPQFGVDGTRTLSGVAQLPLVGTIVKPSVGLTVDATAELVDKLAGAGIDFIKDDELQCDGPHNPFEKRVSAVMDVLKRHADSAGRMVMYAFNVTGEIDEMKRRHDTVLNAGGTCVMVSLNSVGLAGVIELRRHSQLAIHSHRNGFGMFDRSPALGMSYVAYQKFYRLAGVDQMHVNGLRNKFCESDASVMASARACLAPMSEQKSCVVMPVFSSGQSAGRAFDTYAQLGAADLIFACGGGIVAHPDGPAAGVESVRAAWACAMEGLSLEAAMARHGALRAAVEKFGA